VLALAFGIRCLALAAAFVALPWATTADVVGYRHMVEQSDAGHYPFIHFWMEYPPVFPLLATAFYRLLALLGQSQHFVVAYGLATSLVEMVNLGLVYRLADRAHGARAAGMAALVYALSPVPVWFGLGWFDALAVLALLVGLLLLLDERAVAAGVAVALGIGLKLFPGLLALAAPLALGWRGAARFAVTVAIVLLAIVGPLALLRSDLLLGFLGSLLTRPPWETLPALLLRTYAPGILVPIEDRYTAASGFQPTSGWASLALVPQLLLLLVPVWAAWRLLRGTRRRPSDVCLLAALGLACFLLGGKGFSPQFVVWLLPLIAVVWPNRTGLLYTALFSLHTLAYYWFVLPALDAYYGRHAIALSQVAAVAWVSVLARTLLLAVLVAHLALLAYCRARSAPPAPPAVAEPVLGRSG
jgi:hypothetical protein